VNAEASPRAWPAWEWSAALRGLTYAIPAAVVLPVDVRTGAVVAVGTIPAAIVPMAPRRRGRIVLVVIGAVMAVSVVLGSVLATRPLLGVAVAVVVGLSASRVSDRAARRERS
jgi:hypothetical protein